MNKNAIHGMTKSREYKSWRSMKERCLNPNNPDYDLYGGRGILICSEWVNDFVQFFKDMGTRPEGCTLDRIDSNRGYSKENCRWATETIQKRNRSCVIPITWNGETKTIREWADEIGILDVTLRKRIRKWPLEKAMTQPIFVNKSNPKT